MLYKTKYAYYKIGMCNVLEIKKTLPLKLFLKIQLKTKRVEVVGGFSIVFLKMLQEMSRRCPGNIREIS